ncbi:AAA family ATPase [Nocardia sp. CA-120079]|uniref:AAA family ATPase n=1 Tax=Nocardia sp. CA-120079 TaxID=3239974 RepID=UPI003D97E000
MNNNDSSSDGRVLDGPDRRDGLVYIMSEYVDFAVRVALATGRPLLLRGEPGSGKSSLAAFIARERRWRYYEHVVTSRTQARDLLWTFDSVRRLGDAQARNPAGAVLNDSSYIEPGVLWWAFARESARRRGADLDQMAIDAVEPNAMMNADRSADHAVVLIDEIDKAEPDVPNGLLVPIGSNEFVVTETNSVIRKEPPRAPIDPGLSRHLVVVTTNEERELPQAFLRRCVVLWLDEPGPKHLVDIARAHLKTYDGGFTKADKQLADELAAVLIKLRVSARDKHIRAPSTAEYLDALRACRELGVTVDSDQWAQLRNLTLLKPQQPKW